jgi:hypothetical protein
MRRFVPKSKSFLLLGVAFALAAGMTSPAAAQAKSRVDTRNATILVPHGSPFACQVDEGYGRWSNCDQGGGGSN